MSAVEQKLKELGYTLPECPKPVAAYVPAAEANGFVYVSGQLPMEGGEIKYKGKVGAAVSEAEGYAAAKLCALRMISALQAAVGDLDRVRRIVKVTGYVNSAEGFANQPAVINGASELLQAVFGEKGMHARAAVGVAGLPGGAAVEVELIAAI
jgi:enamine deaminase RidA (YjgF/YER057c/UK114 family)